MKFNTKKNYKKKTHLIIISTIVIVLLVSGVVFAVYNSNQTSIKPGEQGVNLERSDTEKAAEQALKDDPGQKLENEQNDTPTAPTGTTPSGKRAVNVILNYADIDNGTEVSTVVAAGSVTNVTEDNGECTYVFTNQGTVVTKKSSTLVNPTSTTCSRVSFPSSELSKNGTWSVMLKYSSNKSEGTSNELRITK
jgi:flagellar basal body-associated protein FliL